MSVKLDDMAIRAFALFGEAAERARAYGAWEASEGDRSPPLGASATAGFAIEAVETWRAEAAYASVLTAPPADPDAVEGEPEGLPADLSLLYRQFAAQVAAAQGE